MFVAAALGLVGLLPSAFLPPSAATSFPPSWDRMLVVDAHQVPRMDLEMDRHDLPHILYAYHDLPASGSGIGYAHWTGSLWVTEDVAVSPRDWAGDEPDLLLTANGLPHAFFTRSETSPYQQVLYEGVPDLSAPPGTWTLTPLDQGNYIWSVRAATAPGVLGAVYRIWNGTASEFRFVENRGGGWMPPRTLAVNQTYYADFDLVYDSDREPVIVYHFETGEVFLQRGGGPAASTTLLFDMANGTEELGVNLRMQIDGADRVHLAYTWDPPDPAPYGEIVAYRFETGTGWQQEEVAQDGLVCGGCGFDFQLDGSGRPYVTHLDKYDETRVFHCEFNGTWEEDDLPPELDTMEFSLEIGVDGTGRYAYMVDTWIFPVRSLDLWYATQAAPSPLAPQPPTLTGAGLGSFTPPTLVPTEDVILHLQPSADERYGANNVAGYEVWHGETYDATGDSYTLLATLPVGTTEYVHEDAGADQRDHFYEVRVLPIGGGPAVAGTRQAAKLDRMLAAGTHLLSVPLEQADPSPAAVLRTVAWSTARTFDSGTWRSVHSGRPGGTFQSWQPTSAAWVHIESTGWWTVAGLVPSGRTVTLHAGWNLVGLPSLEDGPSVAEVMALTGATRIEAYDATAPPYSLRLADSSEELVSGLGYWISVPQDTLWVV